MSLRMEDTARYMSLRTDCADTVLGKSKDKVGTVYLDDMAVDSCASKLRTPDRMDFGNSHARSDRNHPPCVYTASIGADSIFEAAHLHVVAAAIHGAGNAFSASDLCEIAHLPALHGLR
ncbi:hypothetical protein AbraIFM66951_002112 [Aspergillus brasiliensis]|uniref:Uncharacterized protein n=1 Tax=Aspergillus brasiliensis TaxID=319629 RepID=A0A9W5YVH9_9EURO|nr:hypothetical protein AbraCBS73388_009527 [Aspergillus brasiliensis]GKZ49543.1 hypothetical protein AbraIFM66951_002112 [Aspergillus brasiliensis]